MVEDVSATFCECCGRPFLGTALDVIEKAVAQFEEGIKDLRREFVFHAWALANSRDEAERPESLNALRAVAEQIAPAEEERNKLHALRHSLQRPIRAEIAAKNTAENLAKQAEIKQQRIASHEARKKRFQAKIAKAEAERQTAEAERLALEGKRKQIILNAISTGELVPVSETPEEQAVNFQRRSNKGVIRIESGDGR